jgi:hypothetical protein
LRKLVPWLQTVGFVVTGKCFGGRDPLVKKLQKFYSVVAKYQVAIFAIFFSNASGVSHRE